MKIKATYFLIILFVIHSACFAGKIDRKAVVQRHKIIIHQDNPKNLLVSYRKCDNQSTEILRMIVKPGFVLVNNNRIPETEMNDAAVWNWKPLENAGFLTIRHQTGNQVIVLTK